MSARRSGPQLARGETLKRNESNEIGGFRKISVAAHRENIDRTLIQRIWAWQAEGVVNATNVFAWKEQIFNPEASRRK